MSKNDEKKNNNNFPNLFESVLTINPYKFYYIFLVKNLDSGTTTLFV